MIDVRLQVFFSFLLFSLFRRILACRYFTLSSAAVEKNRSQTMSLSWDVLAAIRAMVTKVSRMTANGNTEL